MLQTEQEKADSGQLYGQGIQIHSPKVFRQNLLVDLFFRQVGKIPFIGLEEAAVGFVQEMAAAASRIQKPPGGRFWILEKRVQDEIDEALGSVELAQIATFPGIQEAFEKVAQKAGLTVFEGLRR